MAWGEVRKDHQQGQVWQLCEEGRDALLTALKATVFNLVRSIVIDPMHNLILGEPATIMILLHDWPPISLGLVKSHFYGIWIKSKILHPNHELRVLHDMLEKVHQMFSLGHFTYHFLCYSLNYLHTSDDSPPRLENLVAVHSLLISGSPWHLQLGP